MPAELIRQYCADRRHLRAPDALLRVFDMQLPASVDRLHYRPMPHRTFPPSIEWAEDEINSSQWPLLPNLVPLAAVDEKSFACVVASDLSGERLPGEGAVVRWHMAVAKPEHQAAVLDTAADLYVQSLVEELGARKRGLCRMLDEIGPAYELNYLDQDKRSRDFVIRPVRIACQNVIVGLAAFAHDSEIDGMSVVAWQTCEVPHVGTHEGNRALAALMLCDAFQSGGTMEVRFDRPAQLNARGTTKTGAEVDVAARYRGHPEGRVPASLRRYGRTVGVELGKDDPGCISPKEARELFLAVTPMPSDLAERVRSAVERGVASPERFCFTLLSQVWREVELEFMLAVSDRAGSILRGGADWTRRAERQVETHIARSALITGMLYRRLDATDAAGASSEARVLEDDRAGVSWTVLPDFGAVVFEQLPSGPLPWRSGGAIVEATDRLVVLPRGMVTAQDVEIARALSQVGVVALAVPADAEFGGMDLAELPVLHCPDRIGELDQAIERKLLTARIARS